jgi:hypothetical protein
MKVIKTASGKNRIKISKKEWTSIGKQSGWIKESADRMEVWLVANAMRQYGGNFVQKLGACISAADSTNAQKLKDAFPEYWEKYLEIGQEEKDNLL